jgi:hypothetical protein
MVVLKKKKNIFKGYYKEKWIPAIHITKATVRYFAYHGDVIKKKKKKFLKEKEKTSYLYSFFVTQNLLHHYIRTT